MINCAGLSIFYEFLGLVVLPFIFWIVSWGEFISGKLALSSDAFIYYWDSRFFLENISHGVYPLWNPGYSGGVPWNFFLRRIGEANPFYWLISLLKVLGCPALNAYLAFLVFYYFLGLVAFWLLARLFLKDRLTSTCAYLILLFSWGKQLFCCFEVLMFVPLMWFVYFVYAFGKNKKKHQLLGACFCAAVMMTTYIPFFTLTIVIVLLFFFFLFFMKEAVVFLKDSISFIGTHRGFAVISLGFVILAGALSFQFYVESKQGGFVLPSRHLSSTDSSELAVAPKDVSVGRIDTASTVWDITTHVSFDHVLLNQQEIRLGDFFIAYLFFIGLMLGVINPVSRRSAFLLVTGVFLTIGTMAKGRLYQFFMGHVFFFHYMRMLQEFFWLAVLPMAILMVMEQIRVFLKNYSGRQNIRVLIYVVMVHGLFWMWLISSKGVLWSSHIALGASLMFFVMSLMGRGNRKALAVMLWISLMIQPIEIARQISQSSVECEKFYRMDNSSQYQGHFLMPSRPTGQQAQTESQQSDTKPSGTSAYYENPWLYDIRQSLDSNTLQAVVRYPLLFFDNTTLADESSKEKLIATLSKKWKRSQNLVLLPLEGSVLEDFRSLNHGQAHFQRIYDKDSQIKVLSFDANTLRLKTSLDRPRFLLWTNGYHPGWHVYIDGHEGRLLRADYAFKGAWIPSGEHIVVFRFATPFQYGVTFIILFAFFAVLVWVLVLAIQEGLFVEEEVGFEL